MGALNFWLDHQLLCVANGRGDLFQIAAPDTTSKAAKQEIKMIELKRFQLPLATCRSNPFDFERASLALLAKHKQRSTTNDGMPMAGEWRDPAVFRRDSMGRKGAHHHG